MSLPMFPVILAMGIAQVAAVLAILYVCEARDHDLGVTGLIVIWICAVPIILATGVLAIKEAVYGKGD